MVVAGKQQIASDIQHEVFQNDVIHPLPGTAADEIGAPDGPAHLADADIPHLFCRRFRRGAAHLTIDDEGAHGIDLQIIEGNIADFDAPGRIFGKVGTDRDGRAAMMEYEIGYRHVPDDPVPDSDPDPVGAGVQHAVGDGDEFTRSLPFQSFNVSAQRDAVVAAVDDAVADGDAAAAVDVDPVRLVAALVVQDAQSTDLDIFAPVNEAGPVRRVVELDITDPDVSGFADVDHLTGTPYDILDLAEFFISVIREGSGHAIRFPVVAVKTFSAAVDPSAAADDDIFHFETDDEMSAGSVLRNGH